MEGGFDPFDPFRGTRDRAGNPLFGDQPFVMPGEAPAPRPRSVGAVLDEALGTVEPTRPAARRTTRRATPEGEASRQAEEAARLELSQARMDAAQRVAEFDRTLTQAAAEAHRESLRRAAARAAGEPMPAPGNPNAVTTGQQAALEALRARAPGIAMGTGLGAGAAMSEEDADNQAMLAMAALGVPAGSSQMARRLLREAIVAGFNSPQGMRSINALANELGTTSTTVNRVLKSVQGPRQQFARGGFPRREDSASSLRLEDVARLFNSGMESQTAIANELGTIPPYVGKAMREVQGPLQATTGRRGIASARNPNVRSGALLADAFNAGNLAGKTQADIVNELGISSASVRPGLDALQGPRLPDDPMSRAMRASFADRAPGLAISAGLGAGASMAGEEGEMDPAMMAASMLFGLPALGKQGQQDILGRMGSTLYGAHNTRLQALRSLLERGSRELAAPSTGIVRVDAPMGGYSEAGRPTQLIVDRDFTLGRKVTATGDVYTETNGSLEPYLDGATLETSTAIMDPATRTMLPLTSDNIRRVKSFLNTADPRGSQIGKIIDITGQKGTSIGSLGLTPHPAGFEPMSGLEAFGANLLTPDQIAGQAGRLRGVSAVVNANAKANVDLNAAMEFLRSAMRDVAASEPDALGPLARKFFEAERGLLNPRAPVAGRFPTDPVSVMAARGWQGANARSILDPNRFSADDFLNPSVGDIISPNASGRALAILDDAAEVMAEASNRNQATPVNYLEQTGDDVLRLDRDVAGALMPESALRTETGDFVAKALADMNVPVGTYADPTIGAAARNFKLGTAQMLEQLASAGRQAALPAAAIAAPQDMMEGEDADTLSLALGSVLIGGRKNLRQLSKKAMARLGRGRGPTGFTTQLTMAIEKLPKSWSNPRPLADWANLNAGSKGELRNVVLPFVEANGGKATAEEVLEHMRTAGVQAQAQPVSIRSQGQDARTQRFFPQYQGVQGVGRMNDNPPYGEDVIMSSNVPQRYQSHFGVVQSGTGMKSIGWSRWWDEAMPDGNRVRTIGESQSDFAQEIAQKGIPRPFGPFDEQAVAQQLAVQTNRVAQLHKARTELDEQISAVGRQIAQPTPPEGNAPALFFFQRTADGITSFNRHLSDLPNFGFVVSDIVSGLGGKRQERLRKTIADVLDRTMLRFPNIQSLLSSTSGETAEELAENAKAMFRRTMTENVTVQLQDARRQIREIVADAQGKMIGLSRVTGPMGTMTPDEIANKAVADLGTVLLRISDDANRWADQAIDNAAQAASTRNALRTQRLEQSKLLDEAYNVETRLRNDLFNKVHNSSSQVTEDAARLGMFTTTKETTFANTANSIMQAIRDGVQFLALDTPANKVIKASMPQAAADVQYGVNLPSAVNAVHRALGVEPKWSTHTSLEDGVTRNQIEITPELRDMVGRFGAPLLSMVPMVVEDDDNHGRYATAGLDLMDMALIAAAGGAIGGKKILERLASMGASKAARDASKVQLLKVAQEVAQRQTVEQGWERQIEREARNRLRTRDYTFPYPDDAGDPVRDRDTLLEYAGRILTAQGADEELKEITQQFIERGAITAQGRIPIALEQELANQIASSVNDLATRNPENALSGTELLALGKQYMRDSRRKAIAKEAMTDMTLTREQRDVASQLHSALEDRLLAAWQRMHRDRSQKGRDMNLLKQVWRESSDPQEWLYRAQKLAGGRVLDDNLAREIIEAVQKQDFVRAQIAVGKARKGTLPDKAGELFQTNLLASLSRPIRDLISNAVNTVDRVAWMKLAGYYDRMAASMVPNWNRSWGTSTRTGETLAKSAKSGAEQSVALMRGGTATAEQADALRRAAQRYDFLEETAFESPIMQAYAKVVRRMTAASDQPFYEIAFATAIESQAMAMAEATGKIGADLIREADRFAARPTPQMLARARDEALEAVWQQPTLLGNIAKGIGMRNVKSPGARLVGKLLIPFAQTPSAIATQAVQQSPVGTVAGVMMDAYDIAKANNVPDAQRRLIKKLAMGTTGAAWLMLGYMLADDGNITEEFPQDENERAEWDQTGKIPNAVKVGGKWVALSGLLGPQAILMAIGAEMNRLAKKYSSDTVALGEATAVGTARTVLDSPVAQGLDATMRMLNALGDEEKRGEAVDRFVGSYAGGVVPRIVGQTASAMDELGGRTVARDIRGTGGMLDRSLNAMMSNIPGLREQLPAKVSVFGDTMTTGGAGPMGVLSPFRTSEVRETPLTQALDQMGWFPTVPDERTIKSTGETLTREMIRDMRLTEGPEERALLEGILANDENALSYITDAAWEDYETTGDLGQLLASAVSRLRSLRTRERSLIEP
jgi:hypothetical protein